MFAPIQLNCIYTTLLFVITLLNRISFSFSHNFYAASFHFVLSLSFFLPNTGSLSICSCSVACQPIWWMPFSGCAKISCIVPFRYLSLLLLLVHDVLEFEAFMHMMGKEREKKNRYRSIQAAVLCSLFYLQHCQKILQTEVFRHSTAKLQYGGNSHTIASDFFPH